MQQIYAIALSRLKGLGIGRLKGLLERFGSCEAIFKASKSDLCGVRGIEESLAKDIVSGATMKEAEEIYRVCEREKMEVLFYGDDLYPERLRQISLPPILLYVYGDVSSLETSYTLSFLGSRKMTDYGAHCIEKLMVSLSGESVHVIGGLGYGVERHVLDCAWKEGVFSVAVLPSGLLSPYPVDVPARFLSRMREKGCVLSEYLPSQPLPKYGFPARNRILVGLSHALVVIECGEDSNVISVASSAQRENREVFAVPSDIGRKRLLGGNKLLEREIARIIPSIDALVPLLKSRGGREEEEAKKLDEVLDSLGELEKKVVLVLQKEGSVHVDDLLSHTRIMPERLAGVLLNLELRGCIRELAGKRYACVGS